MDSHSHMEHAGHMESAGGMNVMHMTFYWGEDATILFKSWTTTNWTTYWTALLATFIFCVLHEYLTSYRVTLVASLKQAQKGREASEEVSQVPLLERFSSQPPVAGKALATMLYGVNVASSYLIMLVVMSFNIGLFLAVVLGLTLGFFLFGFARGSTQYTSSELCCAS